MPGSITHLKTAHYILEKEIASVSQPKQFYLGSISPDSVNVNGHAESSVRWPAHLRDADLNVWLSNVKRFWVDESHKVQDTSFLLGYVVHIITDIVWDMYFERELWQRFEDVSIPKELRKSERWAELYGYEQLQARLPWFKNDVCPKLRESEIEVVGTLISEQVAIHRDRVAALEVPTGHLPRFVDDEFMARLYSRVSKLISTVILA